ncbi:hypothetical protein D9M71_529690 [compost metagenome]
MDVSALRGQVDLGLTDSWNLRQGAFDSPDTGGTGHAADFQFQGLRRHAVTGARNSFKQGGQAIGWRLHAGLFGRQVDADGSGALHVAQGAFNTAGAACARHAGNRQIEYRGFEHGCTSLNRLPASTLTRG